MKTKIKKSLKRSSPDKKKKQRSSSSGRQRYRDIEKDKDEKIRSSRTRSKSRSRKTEINQLDAIETDKRIAQVIGYDMSKSPKYNISDTHSITSSNTKFHTSENTREVSQEFLRSFSGSFDGSDIDNDSVTATRIFSSLDDDEEDGRVSIRRGGFSIAKSKKSYRSRKTSASKKSMKKTPVDDTPLRPHRRYRGFTSSMAALFQDEQIVCGAIACFGLLLSQRTEYLLNARNIRRGMSRKRTPSTLLTYALGLFLLFVALTYSIWGINGIDIKGDNDLYENDDGQYNVYQNDNNYAYDDDYYQDDYYNDGNNNNRKMLMMRGKYKVHEWHSLLWSKSGVINIPRLLQNGYDDDAVYETYSTDSNPGDFPRAMLFLSFLLLLGVIGRRRRMRTRYEIIKAREQDDHLFYIEGELDAIYDTREDKYEAACSHTLCGCYPVDQDIFNDDDSTGTYNTVASQPINFQKKDFMQNMYGCLSLSCCGKIFKCWIQCLSTCALAQEGREARLLVPPKLQKIDYLTHQPFHEYHQRTKDLRKRAIGGVFNHAKSMSKLSKYLIGTFILVAILITTTLLFNPRSSFGIGNLIVVVATFGVSFFLLYILHWLFHRSDLGLDAVIKMFSAGFTIGVPTAFVFQALFVNISISFVYIFYGLLNSLKAEAFITFLDSHTRFTWLLGEFIQAFFLAAMIEELCKYYTFRTIEHPDLMFISDDDRNKQVQSASLASLYPIAPVLSSDDDSYTRKSITNASRIKAQNDDKRAQEVIEMIEDGPEERSPTQMAGAVTVAMVSVALGLACAENFLYVFLMSDATVMQEGVILFFRSIFPVHALAAALQSLGVIKKYIEKDSSIGVGRIIFPAMIMHGSFDAFLMFLSALEEQPWNYYNEDYFEQDHSVPWIVSILFWSAVLCTISIGALYYKTESEEQRFRLMDIEEYFIHMHENNKKIEEYVPPVASGSMA